MWAFSGFTAKLKSLCLPFGLVWAFLYCLAIRFTFTGFDRLWGRCWLYMNQFKLAGPSLICKFTGILNFDVTLIHLRILQLINQNRVILWTNQTPARRLKEHIPERWRQCLLRRQFFQQNQATLFYVVSVLRQQHLQRRPFFHGTGVKRTTRGDLWQWLPQLEMYRLMVQLIWSLEQLLWLYLELPSLSSSPGRTCKVAFYLNALLSLSAFFFPFFERLI